MRASTDAGEGDGPVETGDEQNPADVHAITCFYVRNGHRKRGLTRRLAMAAGFSRLPAAIEAPPRAVSTDGIRHRFGLGRSRSVVLKLSALFSLDDVSLDLVGNQSPTAICPANNHLERQGLKTPVSS